MKCGDFISVLILILCSWVTMTNKLFIGDLPLIGDSSKEGDEREQNLSSHNSTKHDKSYSLLITTSVAKACNSISYALHFIIITY